MRLRRIAVLIAALALLVPASAGSAQVPPPPAPVPANLLSGYSTVTFEAGVAIFDNMYAIASGQNGPIVFYNHHLADEMRLKFCELPDCSVFSSSAFTDYGLYPNAIQTEEALYLGYVNIVPGNLLASSTPGVAVPQAKK